MFETIKAWLTAHSLSTERLGNELRFVHSKSRSSIMVLPEIHDHEMPQCASQCASSLLAELYRQCAGVSIGNGHIVIGSPIKGGVEVSHGYRLPDLVELRSRAQSLGMAHGKESEAFMMEASWLFIYGVVHKSDRLLRFDREFGTYETISSVESVLNDWWAIVIGDGAVTPPTPDS